MNSHLLIAPNAFKNSLSATAAAEAIRLGFEQSRLNGRYTIFPVGDGGDGTGELIIERKKGQKIRAEARNPFGKIITTEYGLIDDGTTAVIEMANASGLRLLDRSELDPLHASSIGTGDLIRSALDKKVKRIIIGMGGSATVDGGTGILQALGTRFLDGNENELAQLPRDLHNLAAIDETDLDPRLKDIEVTVLCDVDNRLLGPQGAAAIFGPQKGADPAMVTHLDKGLRRLSEVIYRMTGKNLETLTYGGTAGGAAAGLSGLLSARLVRGIDYFLQVTGFEEALHDVDWVITGEGSINEQTLQGKAPFGVATRAKRRGIPVIGLAGRLPIKKSLSLQETFDALIPIGHRPMDLPNALRDTAPNLSRTATEIGNLLAAAR